MTHLTLLSRISNECNYIIMPILVEGAGKITEHAYGKGLQGGVVHTPY